MGSWSMHVEGHGIHDNGRPDDAETMMKAFVGDLVGKGHVVQSATFTAGTTRGLAADDAGQVDPSDGWRHR